METTSDVVNGKSDSTVDINTHSDSMDISDKSHTKPADRRLSDDKDDTLAEASVSPHKTGSPSPHKTGPPSPHKAGPPCPHKTGPPSPHKASPHSPHKTGPLSPHKTGPPSPDENKNDNCLREADECDDDSASEISDFSDFSQESWQPVQGPIAWVQDQMSKGQSPRKILQDLVPSGTVIPDGLDPVMLWKIIINIVSEPPKRKKLHNINTLDDVLQLLNTSKKIIVLTGAGVSVSCGIPDFRSRDGVYARLAKDFPNLPDPQAMFDIHFFRTDPRPFFKFAKEIYPGQFKPSPCHHFIHLLEEKGKLLRNYTQNIDTLEQVAGIQRVIQCHGSFATATCTVCGHKVGSDAVREDIFNQVIPHCPRCSATDSGAVMKPDIVFFGESLPDYFHNQMAADRDECDLLIVIGSSLKVRPVALIPNSLPAKVPQILINRERLHYFNFDVELLGDCDNIVAELCRRLGSGWEELATSQPPLTQILMGDLPTPPASPGPGGSFDEEAQHKCDPASPGPGESADGEAQLKFCPANPGPKKPFSVGQDNSDLACPSVEPSDTEHVECSPAVSTALSSEPTLTCTRRARLIPSSAQTFSWKACKTSRQQPASSARTPNSVQNENENSPKPNFDNENYERHFLKRPLPSSESGEEESDVSLSSGGELVPTSACVQNETLPLLQGVHHKPPSLHITEPPHSNNHHHHHHLSNICEQCKLPATGCHCLSIVSEHGASAMSSQHQSLTKPPGLTDNSTFTKPGLTNNSTFTRPGLAEKSSLTRPGLIDNSRSQREDVTKVEHSVHTNSHNSQGSSCIVAASQDKDTVPESKKPRLTHHTPPHHREGGTELNLHVEHLEGGTGKNGVSSRDGEQTGVRGRDVVNGTSSSKNNNNSGWPTKDEDDDDDVAGVPKVWFNRFRISLAEQLSDSEVLFLPPSCYVFKGAEVFWESDSDDSDDDSFSENSDEDSFDDEGSLDSYADTAPGGASTDKCGSKADNVEHHKGVVVSSDESEGKPGGWVVRVPEDVVMESEDEVETDKCSQNVTEDVISFEKPGTKIDSDLQKVPDDDDDEVGSSLQQDDTARAEGEDTTRLDLASHGEDSACTEPAQREAVQLLRGEILVPAHHDCQSLLSNIPECQNNHSDSSALSTTHI